MGHVIPTCLTYQLMYCRGQIFQLSHSSLASFYKEHTNSSVNFLLTSFTALPHLSSFLLVLLQRLSKTNFWKDIPLKKEYHCVHDTCLGHTFNLYAHISHSDSIFGNTGILLRSRKFFEYIKCFHFFCFSPYLVLFYVQSIKNIYTFFS